MHYGDVIMGAIAPQITSLTIVYSTVYSDADQRKHQSTASLAFVRGIHRGPVNSPHKWPVTRKMFPFDDVIMDRRDFASLGFTLLGVSQVRAYSVIHQRIISLWYHGRCTKARFAIRDNSWLRCWRTIAQMVNYLSHCSLGNIACSDE